MDDGTYNNCSVRAARNVNSKAKGTPGIELDLVNEHGEVITASLWITDNTIAQVVRQLDSTGFQGDDLSDLSAVGSKLCQIVVRAEEYNGKWYPKVAFINDNESTGGMGQPKMEVSAAKAFAAKMRGQVIAARKAAGATTPAPPARNPARAKQAPPRQPAAPPAESTANDDIPF